MEYSFEEKAEKWFARQLKKSDIEVEKVSVGCCEGTMTTRVTVLSFEGKKVSEKEFNSRKCLATITGVIVSESKALVNDGVKIDTYKVRNKNVLLVTVDIERM